MGSQLQISEIFRSLQGESTLAGRPCIFIRLAGCNLQCHWCDTQYATHTSGRSLAVSDILQEVVSSATRLACITGGEPLLQNATPALVEHLLDHGLTVQVETNGSQDISILPPETRCIMDVKCPDSGAKGSTLESNFSCLKPNDEVKFVIGSRRDFEWAVGQVKDRSLVDRVPVLFSPVVSSDQDNDDVISPPRLADWILDSELPIRLQLQLHRIIWPDRERGV